MLAMAVSEELHGRLHHHHDSEHEAPPCEVALYRTGAMDASVPPPVGVAKIPQLPLPKVRVLWVMPDVVPSHLRGGMLAQAPPRGP